MWVDPKGEYDSTIGVPIFVDFCIGPIPGEDMISNHMGYMDIAIFAAETLEIIQALTPTRLAHCFPCRLTQHS